MTPLDKVTAALEAYGHHVRNGSARCPAHDDRTPSLTLAEGHDGRALVKCHAGDGCSVEQIVAALGLSMTDLFTTNGTKNGSTSRIVATYPYTDETGDVLFEAVRFEPKDFRQRHRDGDSWAWNIQGIRRPLYNLPKVIEAVKNGRAVYIPEGEKDCEAIERAGCTATCNPMGAGKFDKVPDAADILRGAHVRIVMDKDPEGERHARQVARILRPVTSSLIVVEPELGKDSADHLGAGRSMEDFLVVAGHDTAPSVEEWLAQPTNEGDDDIQVETSASASYRARLLTIQQLRDLPRPRQVVEGLIDLDSLALMYGPRGDFKTFVALDIALSVATGHRWHGRMVEYGPVLCVVAEGIAGLFPRFEAWLDAHPTETMPENLYVLPEPVNLLAPDRVGALAQLTAELGVKLLVLDTLARCMVGGDENSARDAGLAVEQLDNLRRASGACVMPVHHTGKNTANGARGSSAFEAAADTVLEVAAEDQTVTITTTKQKNHPAGNPIRLAAVRSVDSIVLERWHGQAAGGLGSNALAAVDALAVASAGHPDGIGATAWRLASGLPERTFYRIKGDLIGHNLVAVKGTSHQPRFALTATGAATLSDGEGTS